MASPLARSARSAQAPSSFDGDALARWLERQRPRLRARIERRLSRAQLGQLDSDDLLQEAALVALTSIRARPLANFAALDAWIVSVAVHIGLGQRRASHAIARLRTSKSVRDGQIVGLHAEDFEVPAQRDSLTHAEGGEACAAVATALDGLAEDERTAVVLRSLLNTSWCAVALALERTEAAAQELHRRARRKLESTLDG